MRSGIERRAPLVAIGEAGGRASAGDLDHEVDVVVAEVVADPHAAQDHRLVVEHVELGVVEALLVVVDRDHLVIEQRVRERARPLPQRSPAPVHRHQRPGLQPRDQADALVEEALLRPFQVLVGHPDPVLEDLDLDAAIGGAQQGARDHLRRSRRRATRSSAPGRCARRRRSAAGCARTRPLPPAISSKVALGSLRSTGRRPSDIGSGNLTCASRGSNSERCGARSKGHLRRQLAGPSPGAAVAPGRDAAMRSYPAIIWRV